MTDPDERTINRAITLLGDEHQDEREEARGALHRIFRNTRSLEDQMAVLDIKVIRLRRIEAAAKDVARWATHVRAKPLDALRRELESK